jgi:hypothetical protein
MSSSGRQGFCGFSNEPAEFTWRPCGILIRSFMNKVSKVFKSILYQEHKQLNQH